MQRWSILRLTLAHKQRQHSLNVKKKSYIQIAVDEAKKAGSRGEVPVGAVLVDSANDSIVAAAGNCVENLSDPTAHAELLAIQKAGRELERTRLQGCDLYVTMEPCPMCAQAISFARIRRLYFGAYDPKGGGVEHGARIFQQSTCHHHPEVYGGIEEEICSALLRGFFNKKRQK